MVHIYYFSLLLFCIPTNMILSMEYFNTFKTERQKKTGNQWRWSSISSNSSNETDNNPYPQPQFLMPLPPKIITPEELISQKNPYAPFGNFCTTSLERQNYLPLPPATIPFYFTLPKESSSSSDIFAGSSSTTNRSSYPQQHQARNLSISSSSTTQQYPLQTANRNINDFMDLTQQTPDSDAEEFFNSDENIEVLQQTNNFLRQYIERPTNYHFQQLSTESIDSQSIELGKTKSPIPSDNEDNTVFDREFDNQETLISEQTPRRKKRKINKNDVPDADFIANYYDEGDFMGPTQPVPNFDTKEFFNPENMLNPFKNTDVFQQTSDPSSQQIEEPKNTNYHSQQPPTESSETTLQQSISQSPPASSNKTEQPFSKKRPRKKRINKKEDFLDNACFTIICSFCPNQLKYQNLLENNIMNKFKIHLRIKHPKVTKEETKIYIKKHLQKPELLLNFSIGCPECNKKILSSRATNMKRKLFSHISKKHSENQNYSKESVAAYAEENYTKVFVPADKSN